MPAATTRFVDEAKVASAPKLPLDRPPTKAEMWAHTKHVYEGVKTQQEMIDFARVRFYDSYILRVNFSGWDKPPGWVPEHGESFPRELRPPTPLPTGPWSRSKVEELHSRYIDYLKTRRS